MSDDRAAITVRGDATAEELVAVLAALRRSRDQLDEPSGYERWRRGRLSVLRPGGTGPG